MDFHHWRRIKPKTSSCVNKFVSGFVNQEPFRITVFLSETCVANLSNVYLSTILDEHPKFILSNNGYFSDNERSSRILVLMNDYLCLKNISYDFLHICTEKCFYIVFLIKFFDDRISFMEESEALINRFWTRKIGNVIILGEVKNIVLLVRSQNFKPILLREPSKPVEVGTCDQFTRWSIIEYVGRSIRLNNSTVNVGYFDREPYVKEPSPDDNHFSGLEISLMKVLAKRLKMSVNLSSIEWGNGTDFIDEVNEEFDSDRAIDLAIGGILWNPTELTDFTESYDVVEIVWLVPVHANISLRGLVAPLDTLVWYAIGGVLLFAIILKYGFFHKLTFLEIFSLFMGYSWPKQPIKDSYRLNYISWVIFGFLLTQYYLASLAGQLMAESEVQIENMADLVDSGISYGGLKSHYALLASSDIEDSDLEDHVVETLSKNFVIFEYDDYEKLFHDLIDGENSSFALTVTLNMSAMGSKFNHNNVHKMNEILSSAPITFAVWKGLPYLSVLNRIIVRLVQSGIIQHLASVVAVSENVHHVHEDDISEMFIDSEDLIPAFLLLAMGSTAGFTCLLCEVVVSLWMKRKKKSRKREKPLLKIKRQEKNGSKRKKIRWVESNPILKPNVEVRYTLGYNIPWKEV
ncbi:hypothetical protein KQX54_012963 [Cotesia glomerata]|uniref:Ionotropic receptor n=1 Tax=Cotesia glomerata TaxID=32391 RepID=A0AAV7IPF1_COTGL|nr:hypothetical protein KQX54_012963 [Cotesia glomerata]